MSIAAEPFDAFEVHTVTDVVDPDGPSLFTETVDDAEGLMHAIEEGQRLYYTVYGYRAHRRPDVEGTGVTAIADLDKYEDALDLATALAAGRVKVHDMAVVAESF